jgi:hypothetical protein
MSDEKDEKKPLHPEINFLPPLKMFLAFFDKESRQKKKKLNTEKQEDSDEKKVEKLIEKLSEKDK